MTVGQARVQSAGHTLVRGGATEQRQERVTELWGQQAQALDGGQPGSDVPAGCTLPFCIPDAATYGLGGQEIVPAAMTYRPVAQVQYSLPQAVDIQRNWKGSCCKGRNHGVRVSMASPYGATHFTA